MTTYMIGLSLECDYGVWANLEQTSIMLYLTAGGTYQIYEVQTELWEDATINTGMPIRPFQLSQYHTVWDDVNNEWDVDYTAFTPALAFAVKLRRDQLLQTASNVTLTYDVGGPNEEVLGVETNDRTMEAIGRKSRLAPVNNDGGPVKFKFAIYTPVDGNDVGYRSVPTSFIQEMDSALDHRHQVHFDAEENVMQVVHVATPYEFIQDGLDDLEEYVANN